LTQSRTEPLLNQTAPTTIASESVQRARRSIVVNSGRVAVLVLFIGLWELASVRHWIDPLLYGRPSAIITSFGDYVTSHRGIESMETTGAAILLSFAIGSTSGILFGLVLGTVPILNAIADPFMMALNSIPRIALAPLFIAWFGLTIDAKIALAVSLVFFILAENSRSAVLSIDPDHTMLARFAGLHGLVLMWKVILPSSVPTIFAGLRLSFTYSVLGVIASEMIAAQSGLGQDLVYYSSSFQINTFFAILLLLMVASVLVNLAFARTQRFLLRWQQT
jgi:NitT/TauT family transport system permease protein